MRASLTFCLAVVCAHAATPGNGTTTDKNASLIEAIQRGDTRAPSQRSSARKWDVNAAGPDGATPLMWAAYQDQLDAAELLLAAGAEGCHGQSARHIGTL